MSYTYEVEKPKLFTDEGQRQFLEIRDKVQKMLQESGAFTMIHAFIGGDSWSMMACVDRMVELGEIREIVQQGYVPTQNRVFVKGN